MENRLLIIHDVLGTLFSLDEPINTLRSARPDLSEKEAYLIIFDWYHAVQRDFTTISSHDDYKPIGEVFKGTLPRILSQAGVKPNSSSGAGAQGDQNAYSELSAAIMDSLKKLGPRPGMQDAFLKVYRDPSQVPDRIKTVDLVGATNGGRALTEGFFKNALGDAFVELQDGDGSSHKGKGVGVFSCDDVRIAKPLPGVYAALKKTFNAPSEGSKDKKVKGLWFVASHTWDLYAARQAGFHTAWVTYEEHYSCPSIYGSHDVVASDMKDLAEKILEYERKQG